MPTFVKDKAKKKNTDKPLRYNGYLFRNTVLQYVRIRCFIVFHVYSLYFVTN